MSRFDQDPEQARRSLIRKTSGFALAIAVILFVLGLNGREPMNGARKPAEDISSKIIGVISMPARGLENLVSDIGNHFDVASENKRLKAELSRLRQIENQDLALKEQVDYLETLLKAEVLVGQGDDLIAARAVSETNGPFVRSALINAGQTRGVIKGQAVLTANGLYGRVVRTGRVSSRVLLLSDLNSRVAVMSLRSRDRAILSGRNTSVPSLEFRGGGDWQVGDKVVTSGDDGVLTRGLAVGDVVAIASGGIGVSLLTDKAPIDWVWVQPFTPIPLPESDPAIEKGVSESEESPLKDTAESPAPIETP